MTKTEKETIYTLLSTSESYMRGFSDSSEKIPEFTDDEVQKEITSPTTRMTLEILQGKVASCTRCALCRTRKNTVFGEGVEKPTVLVIGEGPGANEDEQGRPFVGEAGQLLDKMLIAINLSRTTNCYIANVVKCRPPQNRDPLPEESSACKSFLEAQIHLLKPTMILCVGRIAAHSLFNCNDSLTSMRGKIFDFNGIPTMITYHPSALLRDANLKRPAWEDLKLFRRTLDSILEDNLKLTT